LLQGLRGHVGEKRMFQFPVGQQGTQLGIANCRRLRSCSPFGIPSNRKACNLNIAPLCYWSLLVHAIVKRYSSPNIEERYLTETLSSGSKSCSRKFALTSRRNSSR
jgi:hypothetical protein